VRSRDLHSQPLANSLSSYRVRQRGDAGGGGTGEIQGNVPAAQGQLHARPRSIEEPRSIRRSRIPRKGELVRRGKREEDECKKEGRGKHGEGGGDRSKCERTRDGFSIIPHEYEAKPYNGGAALSTSFSPSPSPARRRYSTPGALASPALPSPPLPARPPAAASSLVPRPLSSPLLSSPLPASPCPSVRPSVRP